MNDTRAIAAPFGAGGKPHVVHVVGTLAGGGVSRLLLGMMASPAFAGFRHSVVCVFGDKGPTGAAFRKAGIRSWPCLLLWPESPPVPSYRLRQWIRRRLTFTFSRRLGSLLRRIGADLVHTHVTNRIDEQAEAVIERAGVPWVWTVHGQYAPHDAELERWNRAASLAGARGRVTTVARAVVVRLEGSGFRAANAIEVIHPGVDLHRFGGGSRRDAAWRARLGISPGAVVFGASGRLVPEKAYDVLLQAAEIVSKRQLPVHIVIAGEGGQRSRLEQDLATRRLGRTVTLLGFQEDISGFLANLDGYVMCSRSEGFPIALLEALASGLPCIATKVGGIPEMLGEESGLMVPPEDPGALAAALSRLCDASAREVIAANGRAVGRRYSAEECAARFARIYTELLPPRPQTASDRPVR